MQHGGIKSPIFCLISFSLFLKGFCHKSFPPKFIFFFAKNTSQKEKMLKKLNFKRNSGGTKTNEKTGHIYLTVAKNKGEKSIEILGFELFLNFFWRKSEDIFFSSKKKQLFFVGLLVYNSTHLL